MFSLNLIFSFAIFKDIFQQLVLYYNESSMCQRSLKNSGRLMSFHCYCKMCKTTKSTPLSVSKRLTGTVLLLFLKFLLAYCFCYFIGIYLKHWDFFSGCFNLICHLKTFADFLCVTFQCLLFLLYWYFYWQLFTFHLVCIDDLILLLLVSQSTLKIISKVLNSIIKVIIIVFSYYLKIKKIILIIIGLNGDRKHIFWGWC